MVPFKRIHDFVGLNELEGFLEYWFSVRSFEAVTLKGLPDFFGEFNDLDGRGLVLRRSARVSTMVNTAIHSIWAKFDLFGPKNDLLGHTGRLKCT